MRTSPVAHRTDPACERSCAGSRRRRRTALCATSSTASPARWPVRMTTSRGSRPPTHTSSVWPMANRSTQPRRAGRRCWASCLCSRSSRWTRSRRVGKVSKARAVERGAHIGPVPFGYRRVLDGDEKGTLEPDGEPLTEVDEDGDVVESAGIVTFTGNAGVVQQAYELARQPDGIARAVKQLEKLAPGHRWTATTLRRLLATASIAARSPTARAWSTRTRTGPWWPNRCGSAPRVARSSGARQTRSSLSRAWCAARAAAARWLVPGWGPSPPSAAIAVPPGSVRSAARIRATRPCRSWPSR